MLIRYGDEMTFECAGPTPMVCQLDVHPSKAIAVRSEMPFSASPRPWRRAGHYWSTPLLACPVASLLSTLAMQRTGDTFSIPWPAETLGVGNKAAPLASG